MKRLLLVFCVLFFAFWLPQCISAQAIGPLPEPELSGEWIAGLVYVLLMMAIEYVPPFAAWWDPFEHKRSVVAATGLVAVIALVGLHYAGAFDLHIGPFTWDVVGDAFNAWLAFLGGSWLIWSLLNKAGALPRKRARVDLPPEWVEEDGDGGRLILGGP